MSQNNEKTKVKNRLQAFFGAAGDSEAESAALKEQVAELQGQVSRLEEQLAAQRQEMDTAIEEAMASSRAKSRFLFNMSHDIRTPMNAIKGFSSMAKKYSTDPKKVEEYLDSIEISSSQLLSLINQVLEMSRIESGKIELESTAVNVTESFNSMTTVLAEQAKTKGLEFVPVLKDIRHNFILADETRVGQIALNIAGNAIKYTPEGGRIIYTFREKDSAEDGFAEYVLTVEDNGIGMSSEFQKTIFEPFAREKGEDMAKIQGTGLGMSIVKQLVDLMGGTIELESELSRGTKFDVTLPFRITDEADAKTDEEIVVDPSDFEGKRVLVVEDNELNREIARDMLEENGLIVEEVEDGDIAVSTIKSAAKFGNLDYYDFILMDIQMPRMDGYEATRQIREIEREHGVHIPIIAMTANAFAEDRKKTMEAGMDEHISKPVEVEKLWKALARLL